MSNPENVSPDQILFTLPTISNDIAELDPLDAPPAPGTLTFHEDDWAQIEFYAGNRLEDVQQTMHELVNFERNFRVEQGWSRIYLRQIARTPVLEGAEAPEQLAAMLGATLGAAPVLFASDTVMGRAREAFSIDLGGSIHLYGTRRETSVPVLGARIGEAPDNTRLVDAFARMNAKHGLILVDWCAQMLLTGATAEGRIEVWRP